MISNRVLTSVTLRDATNAVYGLLCVNIDLDRIQNQRDEVLKELCETVRTEDEVFPRNDNEYVDALLESINVEEKRIEKGDRFLEYLVNELGLFEVEDTSYTLAKIAPLIGISADILKPTLVAMGVVFSTKGKGS